MTMPDFRTTTKKELVNRIADKTGQTKVVVKEVLQSFLDEIIDELALGNRLEFREFGVFEVRERAARRAQNPRTLEKVSVPAKRVVKFKVGRLMRQRVCEDGPPEREPVEPPPSPPRTARQPPAAEAPKPPPKPTRNSPF
jgi:integration host factor subunit beta